MTDERTTGGRERDESLREVASAHAVALAGKGGFVPIEITELIPGIKINFRKDELRLDAMVEHEDGRTDHILRMRHAARECLGCLDADEYVRWFQEHHRFRACVPDGATYRIQVRRRRLFRRNGPWVDLYWGQKNSEED